MSDIFVAEVYRRLGALEKRVEFLSDTTKRLVGIIERHQKDIDTIVRAHVRGSLAHDVAPGATQDKKP